MRAETVVALVLLVGSPFAAQAATPDLLVTSRNTDQVLRYDGVTGAFVGVFADGGGLDNPVGLSFGPDKNLYVASALTDAVLRYDGTTGAFLGQFASVSDPRQLNFGPNGDLFVASAGDGGVRRFDGATGAPLGLFASGGGLAGPTSFTFGPDGDLYVVSVLNDRVKRYDGATGAYIGNFVSTMINGPHDVAFGPDGRFYVVSANQIRVRIFDPLTGIFEKNYLADGALVFPLGMQWDGQGRYYLANQGGNEVRQYDGTTGTLLGSFVVPGSGGLDAPLFLTFMPAARPLVEPVVPGAAGQTNHLRVAGFEPGRKVILLSESAPPSVPRRGAGIAVEVNAPLPLGALVADESGAGVLRFAIPASLAGTTLYLRAYAPGSRQLSPLQIVTL